MLDMHICSASPPLRGTGFIAASEGAAGTEHSRASHSSDDFGAGLPSSIICLAAWYLYCMASNLYTKSSTCVGLADSAHGTTPGAGGRVWMGGAPGSLMMATAPAAQNNWLPLLRAAWLLHRRS